MNTARTTILVAAGVLAAVTGCGTSSGPPLGTVSGSVTLDGAPLAGALVIFTPDAPGRSSLGTTNGEGRYELAYLRDIRGANLGDHRVRIATPGRVNGRRPLLPPRYRGPSALSATIAPGSNTIDFALESK